jgi:hypothetical protein
MTTPINKISCSLLDHITDDRAVAGGLRGRIFALQLELVAGSGNLIAERHFTGWMNSFTQASRK